MTELIEHRVLQDSEKPKRIVVLLHGIGQHSGYMEDAGKLFIEKMPDTLVLMPEAPHRIRYSADKVAHIHKKYDAGFDPEKARSWFQTATITWPLMMLKLAFNRFAAARKVNALADHYRDKYGLKDKDIAFFGMSQGGAVALYSAISRKEKVAGVVSHSGMFFGFMRAKSKPDVLMITGNDDDYLCNNKSRMKSFFVAPENSIRRLKRLGIALTDKRLPDLGHEMNEESLEISAGYLAKAFGVAAKPEAAEKDRPKVTVRPAANM